MKEDVISFGDGLTHIWKYIIIDPPAGLPILLNGKEIGGLFLRLDLFPPELNLNIVAVEGIEIEPEYRNKGIGTMVVKMLAEQCDMLVGSITEDEPKPFWKKMGAEFSPVPFESFPDHMQPTIHSKEPQFFWITNNPKASKVAASFAGMLPELMQEVDKHHKLHHAEK